MIEIPEALSANYSISRASSSECVGCQYSCETTSGGSGCASCMNSSCQLACEWCQNCQGAACQLCQNCEGVACQSCENCEGAACQSSQSCTDCQSSESCTTCQTSQSCTTCQTSQSGESASFSVWVEDITSTSVNFAGLFSGGDSSYSRRRVASIWISNGLTFYTWSIEMGGGSSSFSTSQMGYQIGDYTYSGPITGLSPNTTYTWAATLGYIPEGGGVEFTSYTASGSFTTIKDKFYWTYAGLDSNGNPVYGNYKVKGYGILVTAAEWNELVSMVNDEYGTNISAVPQGWPIYADIVNQVASTVGVSTVSSGSKITASFFNSLMYAFNA